jgi:hypothetical protein
MSDLVVLPCHARSAAWHHAVRLPYIVVVPDEWSAVLTLHCSCAIAACPHVLQALTVVPVRTSYKPMMALMSAALKMCMHALGIEEPCYIGKPTRPFFMLEPAAHRGP